MISSHKSTEREIGGLAHENKCCLWWALGILSIPCPILLQSPCGRASISCMLLLLSLISFHLLFWSFIIDCPDVWLNCCTLYCNPWKSINTLKSGMEWNIECRWDKLGMSDTVESRYNEVLGTMQITLFYQVYHYIRVKLTKNYKELGQAKLPCYNRVMLYPTSL